MKTKYRGRESVQQEFTTFSRAGATFTPYKLTGYNVIN
jgi:hypothetical protein